ncbi:MAG: LPS export ABC transporter periplasmic protein LptC [Gammaproteobacteria bacterium]|nr:LPS export ABC transporter periplasmic protein LptC [Gammaproteobacteria bacterium]
MSHWRLRLVWLALAVVAGASTWLVLANRGSPPSSQVRAGAPELPDYSLTNAVMTRYGESGQPRYVLRSDRIIHRRDADVSLLTRVDLDYYPLSNAYWHLSARRGRISNRGNHVVLLEQVRAYQPAAANPIHLGTSRLTLVLSERLISTDAPATLRQGARTTRGRGLKADLEQGTVKFLHDVTSRYESHAR